MIIKHKIFGNWSSEQVQQLLALGIVVEEGIDSFEIIENNLYFSVQPLLREWDVMDTAFSEFTNSEIIDSLYAQVMTAWIIGYPQPEDSFLESMYDLSNYCTECGVGKKQSSPFRIKKAPKWSSRKKTFGVHWIHDAFFTSKDYFEQIFKPLGLKSMPVFIGKSKIASDDTVQVLFPVSKTSLKLDKSTQITCSECGREKFLPIIKGFFPGLKNNVDESIFLSQENFGSGASSYKVLILGKELKAVFLKNKFNVMFYPLSDR